MNKKRFVFPSLIIASGALLLGTISHAFALYQRPAEGVSFHAGQTPDLYLIGNFSSWEQDNNYKFVSNTAGMTAEEHKIREYKLENIPLNKGDELKVWRGNDTWYTDGENNCTYEHHWSNAMTYSDSGHNYVVPMTSNTYSFYLKFYDDGSSKLHITANKDILYFCPSQNWLIDNATFAIYQFDQSDVQQYIATGTVVPAALNVYKCELSTEYYKYKFVRRASDYTTIWNQSNMQEIGNSDTNNCFALRDTYYDDTTEIWSNWNAVGGQEYKVSTGEWSTR